MELLKKIICTILFWEYEIQNDGFIFVMDFIFHVICIKIPSFLYCIFMLSFL